MRASGSPSRDDATDTVAHPQVRDRRTPPTGVLPRHVQTWLMVALAAVMLTIILFTGRRDAVETPGATSRTPEPALAAPDRIRLFEQQLAVEEARQQEARAREAAATPGAVISSPAGVYAASAGVTDRQRFAYESLFADNVALSRRPLEEHPSPARQSQARADGAGSPLAGELALLERALAQSRPNATSVLPREAPAPLTPSAPPEARPGEGTPASRAGETSASGPRYPVLEGTVIETVLVNRLDGTFAGPVTALVTTPVYSRNRHVVLIPAGARVLGSVTPVQTWGDSRLAVTFHRLVMPNGQTQTLEQFKGLNQIGETGLRDHVNRHYLQVFGASLAIGGLSGLAQWGGSTAYGVGEQFSQGLGSSLASSAARVLDRYLNVLPTVSIREGHRIRVYLTNDLLLPAYADAEGALP